MKDRLRKAIWRLGGLRVCANSGSEEVQMRFVPTRFMGMTGGADFLGRHEEQLSSTRIRRILSGTNDENETVKALDGVALSPSLLFEYVQRHKRREQQQYESQPEVQRQLRKERRWKENGLDDEQYSAERHAWRLRQQDKGSSAFWMLRHCARSDILEAEQDLKVRGGEWKKYDIEDLEFVLFRNVQKLRAGYAGN